MDDMNNLPVRLQNKAKEAMRASFVYMNLCEIADSGRCNFSDSEKMKMEIEIEKARVYAENLRKEVMAEVKNYLD